MAGAAGTRVPNRALITAITIVGATMQSLDGTIANVALPYMQGSLSASADQVSWVLTSYIVAAAIMTTPVGWLAGRFGTRHVFIVAMTGFTVASMMCGAAQSLSQMVLFRTLQGVFGAALVPLSQTVLIEVYPPEERGQAMALWGMGVMVGPIIGPVLGGWLTEHYSWRFVFYVNLPPGILALVGIVLFLPRGANQRDVPFDAVGFGILAVGLGAFQLMLDRGQDQDWFGAREIVVEAVLAGLCAYLAAVHFASARAPLFPRALFRDRNLLSCIVVMFVVGMILFSTLALMAPWLQTLSGYPVQTAGLMLAPQGFATLTGMQLVSRLYGRLDPRVIMGVGIALLTLSLLDMTGWTPDVAPTRVVLSSMLRGFGIGLVFVPMQVIAFSTVPTALRTGATVLMALIRNIGSAVGVSVFTTLIARNTQTMHAVIAAQVSSFDPALRGTAAGLMLDPRTARGAIALEAIVDRQAAIVAYLDDFWLLMVLAVPSALFLLLLRVPRRPPGAPAGGPSAAEAAAASGH